MKTVYPEKEILWPAEPPAPQALGWEFIKHVCTREPGEQRRLIPRARAQGILANEIISTFCIFPKNNRKSISGCSKSSICHFSQPSPSFMSNGTFPASETLFMDRLPAFVRTGFAQEWRVFSSLNQARGHWRDIVYPDTSPVDSPASPSSSRSLLHCGWALGTEYCNFSHPASPSTKLSPSCS